MNCKKQIHHLTKWNFVREPQKLDVRKKMISQYNFEVEIITNKEIDKKNQQILFNLKAQKIK